MAATRTALVFRIAIEIFGGRADVEVAALIMTFEASTSVPKRAGSHFTAICNENGIFPNRPERWNNIKLKRRGRHQRKCDAAAKRFIGIHTAR